MNKKLPVLRELFYTVYFFPKKSVNIVDYLPKKSVNIVDYLPKKSVKFDGIFP